MSTPYSKNRNSETASREKVMKIMPRRKKLNHDLLKLDQWKRVQEMIPELTLNNTQLNNFTLYLEYLALRSMDQMFSSV